MRLPWSCLAWFPSTVRADLIATISSTPTVVGNDIYLDVTLKSTSIDDLASFNLSYEVDQPGLQFYTVSPGVPDELQLSNPDYVLYGNSLATNSPPGGSVDTTNLVYTQADGVDVVTTGIPSVAVDTTPVLLATLHLVAVTSGTYTIRVDHTDPQNGFIAADNSLIAYSFNSASVTVGTPTVPEPSSLLLGVIGSAGLLCWGVYRRK